MAEVAMQNMEDELRRWAEIAIDHFHNSLDKYEIGKLDGDLWKSFAFELVQNGGNIERVLIKFKQYGRFVDMGVGRGVAIGRKGTEVFGKYRKANGQLIRYGRRPKPWYSKTKTREVGILRSLLVSQYQVQTLATIDSGLTFTENIQLS
jgi:hypothetical protein